MKQLSWLVPGLLILLWSCGNKKNTPDVSGVKVSLQTERFEQDFFALDTLHIDAHVCSRNPVAVMLAQEQIDVASRYAHEKWRIFIEPVLEFNFEAKVIDVELSSLSFIQDPQNRDRALELHSSLPSSDAPSSSLRVIAIGGSPCAKNAS